MPAHRLVNLLLLAALLGGSILIWPALPDRITVHFGLDGTPDRWARRSIAAWFLGPLVAIAAHALLYWAARLSTRNVRRINLPNKKLLLELPTERQRLVLDRIRGGVEALGPMTSALFCLIQLAVFRTAIGMDGRPLKLIALALGLLILPIASIWLVFRVQREVDRQIALHREIGAA